MNVHAEMLNRLAAYFRDEIDVAALRDYMVGQYLNSSELADDDKKFLSEFEGRYAELSDELISEPAFKMMLATCIISSVQVTVNPQFRVLGASASTSSYGSPSTSGTCSPELPVLSHA
jgi:hypothetical protein